MDVDVSELGDQAARVNINPQQSGRHERTHLTLKKDATKPAAKSLLQQQAKFDQFVDCFNRQRPHQVLQRTPRAELYSPSARAYNGVQDLNYPFRDCTITGPNCGRIYIGRRKVNVSQVFAGQNIGIKEVEEKFWLVNFMHYDLGFFDHESGASNAPQIPSVPKGWRCHLPMVPGVNPCVRNGPNILVRPGEIRTPDLLVRSRNDDFLGSYFFQSLSRPALT